MKKNVINPLPHQIPIINKIKEYYSNIDDETSDDEEPDQDVESEEDASDKEEDINHGKRGKLILPCGYGKMFISLFYLTFSFFISEVVFIRVLSKVGITNFFSISTWLDVNRVPPELKFLRCP